MAVSGQGQWSIPRQITLAGHNFKKFYLIMNNKEGKINPQDLSWGRMSGAQNARRGSLPYVYYVFKTWLMYSFVDVRLF